MADQEDPQKREKEPEKPKKAGSLAPCTVAPSAEHARAGNEDEPCDDGRSGS